MESLSAGSNAFFRLSPAANGKPFWFAIRRGEIKKRVDAYSNQPYFRALFSRIQGAGSPVSTFAEMAVTIFSGSTPLAKGDAYIDPPAGVRFLRSGEISSDGDIADTSTIHIRQEVHDGQLKRSQIQHGDLLIAIVGATIGSVGMYTHKDSANINQAIAAIRLHEETIRREFALWYMHSSIGQSLLDYFKRPVARANINLEEVGEIPVIVPDASLQNELVSAMDAARAARRAKLAEADELLGGLDGYIIEILGITPPSKDEHKVFAITRNEIQARLDPHFHLPSFVQILKTLSKNGSEPLGNIAAFSKEVWKAKQHAGEVFHYIEISSVNRDTGEATAIETLVAEAPSRARKVVQLHDMIVSLTRPHHGSIAQITTALNDCVASTGFSIIRDVNEALVSRDYLWCILRTKMCLSQMLQRASGGNYPAITEPELAKILIPIPDKAVQKIITIEANSRREEARRLRTEAEADWKAAKLWFEEQLLGAKQP